MRLQYLLHSGRPYRPGLHRTAPVQGRVLVSISEGGGEVAVFATLGEAVPTWLTSYSSCSRASISEY